jgi:parvulin-like peptidyl-prolyl isomerase
VNSPIANCKSRIAALCALLLLSASVAGAQLVASHAPTGVAPTSTPDPMAGKPVARVNDAVLTERDLMREPYSIFPYASQHNGIPKSMEPEMRRGALDMIEFEELLYQEALRRKMTVPQERMQRAEMDFRKQFSSQQDYEQALRAEANGSPRVMSQKIRRALLIQELLKLEVEDKAKVSPLQAKAYYDQHPKEFAHSETFSIQTISILPPRTGGPEVQQEARKRAQDAARRAKATKSYQEFGLLAESVSDDDWRVNLGDRKAVAGEKLPPEVVKAALAMQVGQVSDLIQLGNAYTIFRLNAHDPAGETPFAEIKDKLRKDLEKSKVEQLRSGLDRKLRQNAKIEEL